jgi:5-hydroxyisourate hydrolase-like protein (transthyretin family)
MRKAASLKQAIQITAVVMMLCAAVSAQTVTGVVTNRTNNKPAANDDVVLLKLAQGMQELARSKTDNRGRYTIKVPASEAGSVHLLRVNHDGANYFAPVPPTTTKVDLDVYTAAAEVEGIVVSEDVLQIQTTPDGGSLRVVEHYLVRNDSQPQRTLFSEHPFEIYLPAGATVDGATAKAPGGMGVEQPLVPMADPNHYTILFPVRPGETEFNVWYKIPYKGSFDFKPRLTLTTEALGIMMPRSMNFKSGPGSEFRSVSEQVGGKSQAFLAQNVKPSQPLSFTIDGKGELPRDAVGTQGGAGGAGGAAGTAGAPGNPSGTDDPNANKSPGGGLGTPLDKDAERDPWTKYRWWIIGGLGLVLAAAAGLMLRTPTGTEATRTPYPQALPTALASSPAGALQVLRDEMFAVETDRLEGRLTDSDYAELKSAYDVVLRRALARNQKPSGPTTGV